MPQTRPINSAEKQNFETLISAIKADDACLMSVFDHHNQKPVVMICAVNRHPQEAAEFEFVPLAVLCDGDPYSRFMPPMQESSP